MQSACKEMYGTIACCRANSLPSCTQIARTRKPRPLTFRRPLVAAPNLQHHRHPLQQHLPATRRTQLKSLCCAASLPQFLRCWMSDLGRLLLGWEMCRLQGIPCDALPNAKGMNRKLLGHLAGDAFCGAAFSAVLCCILLHLPEVPETAQSEDDEHVGLGSLLWVSGDDD